MAANGTPTLAERMKTLIDRTGFPHDIHPGQRRYGPRPDLPDPPKDAEIFVGKIPKVNSCFVSEFIATFKLGVIHFLICLVVLERIVSQFLRRIVSKMNLCRFWKAVEMSMTSVS